MWQGDRERRDNDGEITEKTEIKNELVSEMIRDTVEKDGGRTVPSTRPLYAFK